MVFLSHEDKDINSQPKRICNWYTLTLSFLIFSNLTFSCSPTVSFSQTSVSGCSTESSSFIDCKFHKFVHQQ